MKVHFINFKQFYFSSLRFIISYNLITSIYNPIGHIYKNLHPVKPRNYRSKQLHPNKYVTHFLAYEQNLQSHYKKFLLKNSAVTFLNRKFLNGVSTEYIVMNRSIFNSAPAAWSL